MIEIVLLVLAVLLAAVLFTWLMTLILFMLAGLLAIFFVWWIVGGTFSIKQDSVKVGTLRWFTYTKVSK